jgi:hypothetical protein
MRHPVNGFTEHQVMDPQSRIFSRDLNYFAQYNQTKMSQKKVIIYRSCQFELYRVFIELLTTCFYEKRIFNME